MSTKWPRVSFTNRHGVIETGDVAFTDEKETVIRIERSAKLVPTPMGLREFTGVYETVKNEYLIHV